MATRYFNLRKWNSNSLDQIRRAESQSPTQSMSQSVNELSPEAPLDNTLIGHGLSKSCTESEVSKLLGITWNSQFDD